jgi:hypothetical protein
VKMEERSNMGLMRYTASHNSPAIILSKFWTVARGRTAEIAHNCVQLEILPLVPPSLPPCCPSQTDASTSAGAATASPEEALGSPTAR